MRFLHLSDLHIGKRVNEFPMLDDQRVALERILAKARDLRVDALLVAGDLYDKSSPSAEAVALVDWFLESAVDTGLKVFAVAGNHDSAERVAYVDGLLARQGVHLAPVYDGSITRVALEDEHGPLNIWLIPFLKPATVRPHFQEHEFETYTEAMRLVLSACEVDTSQRNVALSHQFVTCGGGGVERAESELSLGGMDNVDSSVYEMFDYVALGHVHRPQRVQRDEVRYSGSLLKYSFSEIRDTKSAPLIELGPKGCVSIELVPIEPLHDMRCIRGTLDDITAPDARAEGDPEDYLYVILEDEHPSLNVMERLRSKYPNVMGFDYDNTRTRNVFQSGVGVDASDVESQDVFELFAEFYCRQNGDALSESQKQLVAELLQESGVM